MRDLIKGWLYLRSVQNVSIHHFTIYGHERPQVDVHTVRVQPHQCQNVKEELGPLSQILRNKREGQNLSSFIPDEGLLRLNVHQLFIQTHTQTDNTQR